MCQFFFNHQTFKLQINAEFEMVLFIFKNCFQSCDGFKFRNFFGNSCCPVGFGLWYFKDQDISKRKLWFLQFSQTSNQFLSSPSTTRQHGGRAELLRTAFTGRSSKLKHWYLLSIWIFFGSLGFVGIFDEFLDKLRIFWWTIWRMFWRIFWHMFWQMI